MLTQSQALWESTRLRVQLVQVQGLPIIELDFSNGSPQDTLAMLDEFKRLLQRAEPDSLRVLSCTTDMTYDPGVSSKWKAIRMEFNPKIRASAVYGASSFVSVATHSYIELMKWLGMPRAKDKIRIFPDREKALEWLLKI
jgi:hypothetical protein